MMESFCAAIRTAKATESGLQPYTTPGGGVTAFPRPFFTPPLTDGKNVSISQKNPYICDTMRCIKHYLFLWLLGMGGWAVAQNTAAQQECVRILADGKVALARSEYKRAFDCFAAVKVCNPAKTAEVDVLIKKAFQQMAADRERAIDAEANAQQAAADAIHAKEEALKEKHRADSIAQVAQANFEQADKLVKAFYFL